MGILIYLAALTLILAVSAFQCARREWGHKLTVYKYAPPEKQELIDTDAYQHTLTILFVGGTLLCATLLLSLLIAVTELVLVILYGVSGALMIWGFFGLIKLMIQDYKKGL